MTVQSVPVDAGFRHSSGVLGTHFFKTLRDEKRLVGWKAGLPSRVVVPPRDCGGSGEWVDVGPGAKLEAFCPPEWTTGHSDGSVLALVKTDGADTSMLARLRLKGATAPVVGQRLTIKFAAVRQGDMADFWFECTEVPV